MITIFKKSFLILCLLIIAACTPIPQEWSEEEAVGSYVLNYKYGTEELTINSDGTYTQSFNGEEKFSASGNWSLVKSKITLENAYMFDNGFGMKLSKPQKGTVRLITASKSGEPVLILNADQGYFYERQN